MEKNKKIEKKRLLKNGYLLSFAFFFDIFAVFWNQNCKAPRVRKAGGEGERKPATLDGLYVCSNNKGCRGKKL